MRLLIDSHILLWSVGESRKIPAAFRPRLVSPDNQVLFSAASIWEIAIKMQIGRLRLPIEPDALVDAAIRMGFDELPVAASHAARVRTIPMHHRDPFDRLLVAQALCESARLLTVDRELAPYSDLVELPR